ncbi:MAG TPA: nitroreductase family protein [Oscillospiraceae bacterium]|nr:nitroreductase family protein [Oscillospiraceae bacterium]HPF56314.1 nitroreductase family protein [Clostridiales bacterium]HPK34231.1 nitroreductase family protein [Oscillospiraceae bacterium]HPR74866.1 nitroreductase family protein [Oscillospiraceae bacterium]
MEFFELIQKRESCRNFKDAPVENNKLLRCVESARLAPSACNSQPWRYIVVNEPELSPKVAKCVQDMGMNKFASNSPAFAVVLESEANLMSRLGGKVKDQQFAPIDIGLSVAHFCLEATDLGLSTCILGWLNETKLKDLLGISKQERVRLVIAIGYAANDTLRTKQRKSLETIAEFHFTEDKK